MRPAPTPRSPVNPVHRLVADTPRFVRACGAPYGRSGVGWGDVTCPTCAALPEVTRSVSISISTEVLDAATPGLRELPGYAELAATAAPEAPRLRPRRTIPT